MVLNRESAIAGYTFSVKKNGRWFLVVALLLFAAGAQLVPAWMNVSKAKHGRDYATYHYAVQEVLDGGDPYVTKSLSRRARAEGTRKSVHPYFYPPPFLWLMLWSGFLSLSAGYKLFFFMNQAFLVGSMWCMRRWFAPSAVVMAFVVATLYPIADNAKMGQANLMVLLIALVGLWRRSGETLSLAAMSKMSPALYLAWWAAQRHWRGVFGAIAGAVLLSVVTLPLVNFETQLNFYTKILPGFSSGQYHGLTVPITLPANHSIPDLYNQLWPGETKHVLSPLAQRAASLTSLGLLAVLTWLARSVRDPLGQANIAGAFTVLLLITPVYTYEHHLVLMVMPAVALGAAIEAGRIPRVWWPVVGLSYFSVAWPLFWLRGLQDIIPAAHWWLQESKFFGAVAIGAFCVAAALRSPRD